MNSGGVISAESEVLKATKERAETIARRVGETARRVFRLAEQEDMAPSAAADHLARERIERIGQLHRIRVPRVVSS